MNKKRLNDEQIRKIISPQVEKLKRDFPEWDDSATQRLVEMMRPYSVSKIQKICAVISKTPLIEKVIRHRAKFGAETVISTEAKANLSDDVLKDANDKIVVAPESNNEVK